MKNSRSSSTYKLFKQERKKISGLVAQKGARLTKFVIDDDGYQIKIVVPEKLTKEETEMFKKLKEISKFNPRRV